MALNLLARELGASIVDCSDEFFGAADALLVSTEPHRPGTYGLRGADVDGWESRRHNPSDHDWIIVRAAHAARIDEIELETTGFRFNAPQHLGVDASNSAEGPWQEILPYSPVTANSVNTYAVEETAESFAFVRLRLFPDGGVARFRAHGTIDASRARPPAGVRLSDVRLGCRAQATDGSFGSPWSVISHSMPANTHDGWETPRRTDASRLHVELTWPASVRVSSLEVVATAFRGNCAAQVGIEALRVGTSEWASIGTFDITSGATTSIEFEPFETQKIRVRALPDGGFSRLWFYGTELSPSHTTHQEER